MPIIFTSQFSTAHPLMEGSGDHRFTIIITTTTTTTAKVVASRPSPCPSIHRPRALYCPSVMTGSSSTGSSDVVNGGGLGYAGSGHHANAMLGYHHQPQHMMIGSGSSSAFTALPFPTVKSIHHDTNNLQHAAAAAAAAAGGVAAKAAAAAACNKYGSTAAVMIGSGSSSTFTALPFPTVESIRHDTNNLQHAAAAAAAVRGVAAKAAAAAATAGSKYGSTAAAAAAAGGVAAKAAAATTGNKYGSTAAVSTPAKTKMLRWKATDPPAAAAKKPSRWAQAHDDYIYDSSSGMNQALVVCRACSNCNKTETPLWRTGPDGPNTLCNACGIKYYSARKRAAMTMASGAAVAADGAGDAAAVAAVHEHLPKVEKDKKRAAAVAVDRSLPFKKRYCAVNTAAVANTTAVAAPVEASAEPFVVVTPAAAAAAAASPARDLAEISMGAKRRSSKLRTSTSAAYLSSIAAACFRPRY